MKPHLRRVEGLWCCMAGGCFGLGYDPKQAFSDWWAQTRRKWTEAAAVSAETT